MRISAGCGGVRARAAGRRAPQHDAPYVVSTGCQLLAGVERDVLVATL
jgi:hypothetical protein